MSPIMYGLIVTLFGLTIVFAVLSGLWGILSMMKIFFAEKKPQVTIENKLNTPGAEVRATKVQTEEMDADELIAVITAAVNACMGGQSNLLVRKITRVGDNTPVWGQISRQEQMLNRF